LAWDCGGEYGHIRFCESLCPLTLAVEASGGLIETSFSFFKGLLALLCPRPPCFAMFIFALLDVMDDWDRQSAPS
jgi:hypothetical protein